MKQKLRRFMAGFLAILTMFTTLFTNGTTAFAASSSANIAFWVASSKDHGVISEFNSKHTGSILYAMIDGHSAYCMNFGMSAKGGQLMNSDSNPNTNLSAAQEKLLAYCMYYGYSTTEAKAPTNDQRNKFIATQSMVWIIVNGIFGTGSADSAASKLCACAPDSSSSYSYYETLRDKINASYNATRPSFASKTKPVALLLHSFNPVYRNLYLFFVKMNRCYNLQKYKDLHYENMTTMQRATLVLKQEMGIDIEKQNNCKDIHIFINEQIKKNNPIIIPVNLKELYYSKFYNKVDWTHSFLIYGYDKDNELYQVFDSVQNVGGKNLYEFVVQKKEMEKLYESFCENIYADGIYYIESNLVDCKKNWYEIFKNGVNEFINYRTEKAYVEIEFIENLCKKENISTAETRKLFEINNYKKVFLKELIHLINMCTIQEEDMEKLSNLCSNIYKSWLEADSQIVYCLKKNKRQEIKKILEKPLYFENQLVHALKYITEENISHDSEECRFLFVNNSDQIINKLDNGNILFCFNQGKTYNNWFDDLAPRFVLKQQDLCQFKLSTEFEIIEYDSCINFCFGVYIKDDSGNSYLFGNNSMNYVCFEHTGVDSGITESYVNENKFKIEIYCNGKELRLRYIESSNISIVFNKKVKLYGNVFQIGITCKTWGGVRKI